MTFYYRPTVAFALCCVQADLQHGHLGEPCHHDAELARYDSVNLSFRFFCEANHLWLTNRSG